jgi:hypothetical protein
MDNLITLALAGGALLFLTRKKAAPATVTETTTPPPTTPPPTTPPPTTPPPTTPPLASRSNTSTTTQRVSASRFGIEVVNWFPTAMVIELRDEGLFQLPVDSPIPGRSRYATQMSLDSMATSMGVEPLKALIRRSGIKSGGNNGVVVNTDEQATLATVNTLAAEAQRIGDRLQTGLEQRIALPTTDSGTKIVMNALLDSLRKLWVIDLTSAFLRKDLVAAQAKMVELRNMDKKLTDYFRTFDARFATQTAMKNRHIHLYTNYFAPLGKHVTLQAPVTIDALTEALRYVEQNANRLGARPSLHQPGWPWTSSYQGPLTKVVYRDNLFPILQTPDYSGFRNPKGEPVKTSAEALALARHAYAKAIELAIMQMRTDPETGQKYWPVTQRNEGLSYHAARLFQLRDMIRKAFTTGV